MLRYLATSEVAKVSSSTRVQLLMYYHMTSGPVSTATTDRKSLIIQSVQAKHGRKQITRHDIIAVMPSAGRDVDKILSTTEQHPCPVQKLLYDWPPIAGFGTAIAASR